MLFIREDYNVRLGEMSRFAALFRESYQPILERNGARLVGLWESVMVARPFSKATSLWEIENGRAWEELVLAVYGDGRTALRGWESTLASVADGGEGRLLKGAPTTPTGPELDSALGVGRAFLQERITVYPGKQEEYAEALVNIWVPLAAAMGRTWIGCYYPVWRNDEVFNYWAVADGDPLLPRGPNARAVLASAEAERWWKVSAPLRQTFDCGLYMAL